MHFVSIKPAFSKSDPLVFSRLVNYNSPMKLIRTWDISSHVFYDYLEKKVAAEIRQNTGRTIRPADFSGFKYRKKGGEGGADTNITIDAYRRGELYKVTARSLQETITNTFTTREKDGKLEVTMTAVISAYEAKKATMSVWKRRFYSFAWHSRMARVLGSMYEELLRQEKEIPAPRPMPGTRAMKHLSEKVSGKINS